MLSERHKECFSRIESLSRDQGVRLFVVGGIVRDLLRGLELNKNDIDILVEGDALSFARQVQSEIGGALNLFPEFLTAKLRSPDFYPELREIDFASARSETYSQPGALPNVTAASVAEDLGRRDFSINALALPFGQLQLLGQEGFGVPQLAKACVDRFQGISDLEQGLIRVLHPTSFIDDPTRLFRALRYCFRINGALEDCTTQWFDQALAQGVLTHISFRRQINELVKILTEENARDVVRAGTSNGLLGACFSPMISSPASSASFSAHLAGLADLPADCRVRNKLSLENCILMILINIVSDSQKMDLYQALSVSRQTRSVIEEDLEMAEESESGHHYSPSGFLYFAIRHEQMRNWALEQLKEKRRVP